MILPSAQVNVHSLKLTTFYDFLLSPPKPMKQSFISSTEQSGQTTKPSNHGFDRTPAVERCGRVETMEHLL
jgi:hypothetical protein